MRIQCDRALRNTYFCVLVTGKRPTFPDFHPEQCNVQTSGCRVRRGRRQAFWAKRRSGQLTDAIAPSEMTSDSCSSDAESETSSADADGAICHPACNGKCRDGSVYRDGSVCHPTSDDEEMDVLDKASTIIQPLVARLISYKAPARLTHWCLKTNMTSHTPCWICVAISTPLMHSYMSALAYVHSAKRNQSAF